MNTRRRQEAKERVARISAGIEQSEGLTATLNKAVDQLEAARGQMDLAVAELRGQSYVIKERWLWLTTEFDKLRADIIALKLDEATQ